MQRQLILFRTKAQAMGMNRSNGGSEDLTLSALEGLIERLNADVQERQVLMRRLTTMRQERLRGTKWPEIFSKEEPPGTMQMISQMLVRLSEASGGLRKEVATCLRQEGMTIPAIAQVFGVSHQRVSNLIRRPH